MTRASSVFVLTVLLSTVAVRLGCAWSCQPSTTSEASEHCHEDSASASAFTIPSGCEDLRSSGPLFAATVRPDAAALPALPSSSLFAAIDVAAGWRAGAYSARTVPPPGHAFPIPLRQ